MYGSGCGVRQRVIEAVDLVYFAAIGLPVGLLTTRRNRRTELVFLLKELGGKVGVLLG
jgi:hypothetical protein